MPVATINPSPNPASQLDRAIIAYLWEIWPVTETFPRPQFYFANDNRVREVGTTGLIDCLSHDATEVTPHTRNELWSTRIDAKWPGANQPGSSDPNWNHRRINDFIGVVMAALSQTDNAGADYRATYRKITAAGRRLAVFGSPDIANATAAEIAHNDDMADFNCFDLRYAAAQRLTVDQGGGFNFGEVRSFQFEVNNIYDDSVYPRLTYSGGSLSWEYTANTDPNGWILEKSADGLTWLTHETISGDQRTTSITGTGTQYWRLFPRNSEGHQLDGESNTVQAEGA